MVDKIYERLLVRDIVPYLNSPEGIVILGARQVGKTSLLRYLIEHYLQKNVFYLDLELRELLDLCNLGAEEVYRYLLQRGADEKSRIYLIIDEIQYLENPTNMIKVLHDHYPQVKLLVSGSSTFDIKKKFKQSLAGRIVTFELYALRFEEFLEFKGKKYHLLAENILTINNELVSLAEEYIRFGSYPLIVLEPAEEKKKVYLSQLINTYIRKDIRDIGNIRDISSFNRLLEIIASQSSQLLNISEIANTLGIRRETTIEYLNLLESTFIIKRITPFHQNMRSELTKNPKVFILDTGMMHLLWLKEFPKVILGKAFETFVFLELMKAGKKIHFWRTSTRQEIDFIVSNGKLYALEVKLNFDKAKTRNLKSFSENYDCETITVGLIGLKGTKSDKYVWEVLPLLEES